VADFISLPGTLNVQIVAGDEVEMTLDFDQDLTGYTFTAPIYVSSLIAADGGGASFVRSIGATATTWSVAAVDLAAGRLNLGLSESQTNGLSTVISYRWYLRWVAPGVVTRTVLSGNFSVVSP
jgi:hypothetical protein